jgi:uncharacterized membrane protein
MNIILILGLTFIFALGLALWIDYRDAKKQNDKLFNKEK